MKATPATYVPPSPQPSGQVPMGVVWKMWRDPTPTTTGYGKVVLRAPGGYMSAELTLTFEAASRANWEAFDEEGTYMVQVTKVYGP